MERRKTARRESTRTESLDLMICLIPRACPVEVHGGGYQTASSRNTDATGLFRGASRWRLPNSSQPDYRCHGLVPWSLTLAATKQLAAEIQMPRACPVELHVRGYQAARSPDYRRHGLLPGASR